MKPTEARVEAVLDDYMALKQIGNVYDKEVAHGNMGSDDDDGSEGIVLTDDEEGIVPATDAHKSQKETKSKKLPPSSSKPSAKSSSKSKSSKSKPKTTKTKTSKPKKTAKKPAEKKAAATKSGQPVRCTQPPQIPFGVSAAACAMCSRTYDV
jgi:cell division protein FtsN